MNHPTRTGADAARARCQGRRLARRYFESGEAHRATLSTGELHEVVALDQAELSNVLAAAFAMGQADGRATAERAHPAPPRYFDPRGGR